MSDRVACGGSRKAIPSRIDGPREEAGRATLGCLCALPPTPGDRE